MNGFVDHIFREQIFANQALDRSNIKENEISKNLSSEFEEESFGSELKAKCTKVVEIANKKQL